MNTKWPYGEGRLSEKYPTSATATKSAKIEETVHIAPNGQRTTETEPTHSWGGYVDPVTLEDGTRLGDWRTFKQYNQILQDGRDPTVFLATEGCIDVADELLPLFEEPASWFGEYGPEQYRLATGGMATVESITPDAIIFQWVHNGDNLRNFPERADNFADLTADTDALAAPDRTTAIHVDLSKTDSETATWKRISDDDELSIFEYVPFQARVKDLRQLQVELTNILENPDIATDLVNKLADTDTPTPQ